MSTKATIYKQLKNIYDAKKLVMPVKWIGSTKTELATLLTQAQQVRRPAPVLRDEKRAPAPRDEKRAPAPRNEKKAPARRSPVEAKIEKDEKDEKRPRFFVPQPPPYEPDKKKTATQIKQEKAEKRRGYLRYARELAEKHPGTFKVNKNMTTPEIKEAIRNLDRLDEVRSRTDADWKKHIQLRRDLTAIGVKYDANPHIVQLTSLEQAYRRDLQLYRDNKRRDDIAQEIQLYNSRLYEDLKAIYLDTDRVIENPEDLRRIILWARAVDRTAMKFTKDGHETIRNLNFKNVENRLAFWSKLATNYNINDDDDEDEETRQDFKWSDGDEDADIYIYNDPRWITIKAIGRDKDGLYFEYSNNTSIDLTKYQIYGQGDEVQEHKFGNTHCLIRCLELHNINDALISRVNLSFDCNANYQKTKLNKVAEMIQQKINLYEYDEDTQTPRIRLTEIGDFKQCINIALYKSHYFIYETVNFTVFSSKNWLKCKEHKRPGDIVKFRSGDRPRYKTADEKYTNSLTLIRNLFNDDHFTRIEFKQHEEFTKKPLSLDSIEDEQKPYEYTEKKEEKRRTIIFYADLETVLNDANKHIPFLAGIITQKAREAKIYSGDDCISDILNFVYDQTKEGDNIILYFHNLKYDLSVMSHLLFYTKTIEKAGTVYSVDIKHRGRIYHLRDSYKLIPSSLSKFKDAFNLPFGKQEAIGYSYYKKDTAETANICDYIQHLKKDEIKQFFINLQESDLFQYDETKERFNCMEYYKYYLNYDCLTLREGLKVFDKNIRKLTNDRLDITKVLTTSSMGHAYASINGAYEGIYSITGNLRAYVSKAVQGGRVQANKQYEKKQIIIPGGVQILDAVSLYPSSMERLGQENGLPLGPAKRFTGLPPADACYYIATVTIKKINRFQQMPFVCYKNDKTQSLQYLNEITEAITVYIDSRTLEDWIKYQAIEYEIIEGVYWNEGFNNKIGQIIRHLYNERARYKREKNTAMSEIIKLIMNSLYGKTIQKISNKQIVYKTDFKYIRRNYNNVISFSDKGNGQYRIKMNAPDDSYNLGHIGTTILSMSKRIMNELQDLTNELGIGTYYGDTDSSFMENNQILRLNEEYKKRFNRSLLGDDLQQMQYDFNLSGVAKPDITATKAIFLGKKSYCCFIEGDNKSKFHFKLKGVPAHAVLSKAEADFGGDVFELYKHMSTGADNTFTLNPSITQPSFKFKNHTVFTMPEGSFKRTLRF